MPVCASIESKINVAEYNSCSWDINTVIIYHHTLTCEKTKCTEKPSLCRIHKITGTLQFSLISMKDLKSQPWGWGYRQSLVSEGLYILLHYICNKGWIVLNKHLDT